MTLQVSIRRLFPFSKKIFREDFSSRPIFNNLDFKKVWEEHSSNLTEPFSRLKIDEAVDSCNGQKTSSPDGFNIRFIKGAWEVIKFDIYSIIDEFWSFYHTPKRLKCGFYCSYSQV